MPLLQMQNAEDAHVPVNMEVVLDTMEVALCMWLDQQRLGRAPADLVQILGEVAWTWGAAGQGAVVLVNNDDDDAKVYKRDCDDELINSGADEPDLEPIYI